MTNKIALMLFMSGTNHIEGIHKHRKICRVRMHRHKLDGLAESERMQKHKRRDE